MAVGVISYNLSQLYMHCKKYLGIYANFKWKKELFVISLKIAKTLFSVKKICDYY
jgi:hypothetical protein